MELSDVVSAFVPLLTALCGWGGGRLKEMMRKEKSSVAEMNALKDGVKGLLRKEVISTGLHYIEKQSIPPYGLETMKSCYDPYMKLGDGDPSVSHIMHKCEQLPVKSGSD